MTETIQKNSLIDAPIFVFDDSSKERILNSLGISKDKESKLVDEQGKVLTNQDFELIQFKEFGGVLKSSKIPIKKNKTEIVKYFVNKKD